MAKVDKIGGQNTVTLEGQRRALEEIIRKLNEVIEKLNTLLP